MRNKIVYAYDKSGRQTGYTVYDARRKGDSADARNGTESDSRTAGEGKASRPYWLATSPKAD